MGGWRGLLTYTLAPRKRKTYTRSSPPPTHLTCVHTLVAVERLAVIPDVQVAVVAADVGEACDLHRVEEGEDALPPERGLREGQGGQARRGVLRWWLVIGGCVRVCGMSGWWMEKERARARTAAHTHKPLSTHTRIK